MQMHVEFSIDDWAISGKVTGRITVSETKRPDATSGRKVFSF